VRTRHPAGEGRGVDAEHQRSASRQLAGGRLDPPGIEHVEHSSAHLADLHVPERGLNRPSDIPFKVTGEIIHPRHTLVVPGAIVPCEEDIDAIAMGYATKLTAQAVVPWAAVRRWT
jgi:hypothetical protein